MLPARHTHASLVTSVSASYLGLRNEELNGEACSRDGGASFRTTSSRSTFDFFLLTWNLRLLSARSPVHIPPSVTSTGFSIIYVYVGEENPGVNS